jgi:hypothetical protein
VVAAGSAFIAFTAVMFVRLPRIDHDRMLNSLSIGALHAAVATSLSLIGIALWIADVGIVPVDGSSSDALVRLSIAVGLTAPAALVACAETAGIMPARGAVPAATQTEDTPRDWQL